jgi:hypothetical protein
MKHSLISAAIGMAIAALSANPAFAAYTVTTAPMPEDGIIDKDWIHNQNGDSPKIIVAQGNAVTVATTGNFVQLVQDFTSASNFDEKLAALNQNSNVLMGVVGGHGVFDSKTVNNQFWLNLCANQWGIKEEVAKLWKLNSGSQLGGTVTGSTNLTIGNSTSEPVVIGSVGGDLVLGLLGDNSFARNGDTQVFLQSGNTFGIVAGSASISTEGIDILYHGNPFMGLSFKGNSSATLSGSSNLTIAGHANTGGAIVGSTALALGGSSLTTIGGGTNLTISNSADEKNAFSGITMGAVAGSASIATLGGTATSTIEGATTVEIDSGMSAGIVGGGVAASFEFDGPWFNYLEPLLKNVGKNGIHDNFGFGGTDNKAGLYLGGTAASESQDIIIHVNGDAVTGLMVGGGIAGASSGVGTSNAQAAVSAKNIAITLGDSTTNVIDGTERGKLVTGLKDLKTLLGSLNGSQINVSDLFNKGSSIVENLNAAGAHVLTIGGNVTYAQYTNGTAPAEGQEGKAVATGTAESVTLNLNGGYNVGNIAGGAAFAYGNGALKEGIVNSSSTVTSTNVIVNGGDNVITLGGGVAYATGKNGVGSKVSALSNVLNATLAVQNGIVDGLYGGGFAIDDTNAAGTNASAETTNVVISVAGGTVNAASTSTIMNMAWGNNPSWNQGPSNGSYAHESADLADQGKVAVLGAGIASGAGAYAHSENVTIGLTGGTITGNVFGGGAATLGGSSVVDSSVIIVDGATVEGDIYAGGLAGSARNDAFTTAEQYKAASVSVKKAFITVNSGKVTGDIHAGGYTYQTADGTAMSATSTVESADVTVASSDVFQGSAIDGNGATAANLTIGAGDYSVANKASVAVSAFNTITSADGVKGVTYAFGDKESTTVTGGVIEFDGVDFGTNGRTFTVGTAETAGLVGVKSVSGGTYVVTRGALGFGSASAGEEAKTFSAETGKTANVYVTGEVDLSNTVVNAGGATGTAGLTLQNGALIANAAGNTAVTGSVSLDADSALYFVNVGENLAEGTASQTVTLGADVSPGAVHTDNVFWDYTYEAGTFTFAQLSREDLQKKRSIDDSGVIDFYEALSADDPLHERLGSGSFKGQTNLKGGMNLAAAAGVQMAAIQGTMLGTDAAARRASLTQTFADGITGFAEASGTYQTQGGNADMSETKAELGGVVVGGEWTHDTYTVGALANVGSGTVRGQGDNAGVKNDVDYYGVNLYAGKRIGEFNVVAQAGWMHSTNDLTDSSIGYAKADGVDADVWTLGIRGEMQYALSENAKIVPYVGLNYLRVETDDYSVTNGVKVSDADQNLFTVPVGIAFTGTMTTASGWNWSPKVDVAYIGAFGDRDVEATTTAGTAAGSTSFDVWTESVVRTRFGIEAGKDAFALGVNAGMALGGDDTKSLFGQVYAKYTF